MLDNPIFKHVIPSGLSDENIHRIYELEQEMWAGKDGLGEYLECSKCSLIYSKQDIYGSNDKEINNLTVAEIEKKKDGLPCCKDCGGKLEHRFKENSYIPEIIQRYSGRAHMVMMISNNRIVGFMDGYVSDYSTIFDRDLSYRYSDDHKPIIQDKIAQILGYSPREMFSCPSMGTTQEFKSFRYAYLLLQNFFGSFPKEYQDIVGITELNIGGGLERLYRPLGAKLVNTGIILERQENSLYNSGIYIQPKLGRTYKEGFLNDLRTFLKKNAI